jgi:trans-aconitate methyltransferase
MSTYSWNAEDYAQHSSAQQTWARELIAKLRLQGDERVLDLGCGDGKVTVAIAQQLPKGRVVGVDNSAAMIQLAQQQYPPDAFPNVEFCQMDARQLTFDMAFTLVFSNAVLHWIDDHPAVLRGLYQSLQPGGYMLLQMGGQGNAADIIQAFETVISQAEWASYFQGFRLPYTFYGVEHYLRWLPEVGFDPLRIELLTKTMTHAGADGLAGWIRTTWMPYTQQVPPECRDELVNQVVEVYLRHHPIMADGNTDVRMVRLEVEARKPLLVSSLSDPE